jgi:hypothetical protein
VASVPAALTVPAGQFGTHFSVTTAPVTAPVTVKLTAMGGGSTVTTTLVVEPLRLVAVDPIDYASYYGARIDLNGPAPVGGFTVAVTSSDPSLVTVPATVVVPAGSAFTFFPAVNQTAEAQTVTLTITAGGVSVSTEATIKPARLGAVGVAQTRAPGGNTITGTVALYSFAPPGGITVALSSSDPSALEVPASVTVPAGADRVEFPVVLHTVDDTQRATITATQGTVTSTVAVTITELHVSQLTLSQSAVVGGSTLEATVTLTGTVEGTPCAVRVFPVYVDYIAAPEWVVIPVGARSATFTIQTTAVAASQNVLVRVGVNSVVKDAPLTLLPDPATPTTVPEPTETVTASPTPADAALAEPTSTPTPESTEPGAAALPAASPVP